MVVVFLSALLVLSITLLLLLMLMATILERVLGLGAQECTGQGADNTVTHLVAAVEPSCTACHGAHDTALALLARSYIWIAVGVRILAAGLCVVGSRLTVLLLGWVLAILVLLLLTVGLWWLAVLRLLWIVVVVWLLLRVLEAAVFWCSVWWLLLAAVAVLWCAVALLSAITLLSTVATLRSTVALLWCAITFLWSAVTALGRSVALLSTVAALVPRV